MSYLPDHITAARAYEAAHDEAADKMEAMSGPNAREVYLVHRIKAGIHRRAAEIMEAELKTRYAPQGDWPVQEDGA